MRVTLLMPEGRAIDESAIPSEVRATHGGVCAEAEGAAARAWYWPEAREVVAKHRSHVTLELEGEEDEGEIDRALRLTRVAASLAASAGAVLYAAEGVALVHSAAAWIEQSADATPDDLPLYLWVAFEGTKNADGTLGMRTHGVRALIGEGAPACEVEVESSKRDGEAILDHVYDVALYALTSPEPIESGEPLETTHGKVRVRIEPSLRNDGTKAYRVRLA